MPDIFHHFPINASPEKVFEGIATPKGLDTWWTESSSGKPAMNELYELCFGPPYIWSAVVSKCVANTVFELTMKDSDTDWLNTKVGFVLAPKKNGTTVHFYHTGWKEDNEQYRISNYCWAMYLRILKRNIELGEEVAYKDRLNV
jgi:uncharacterized protein YndB with AHSA1/START domain